MPFTLAGWSESQDSAVLIEMAALADQSVRVAGDEITVPRGLNMLLGYYFFGLNFTQGRLSSPSLRRIFPIDIEPADIAVEPGSPSALHWLGDAAITLDETEALTALAAEDGAAAIRTSALVWLGDAVPTPEIGPCYPIRATGTTTLVANAWTNGVITFAQTLAAGRYACRGARASAAGLQAFRFVPIGGSTRPGAIGYDADSDLSELIFRRGGLGTWFEFDHDAPPSVDYLSNSADTAEVLHLDLVPLGI